MVISGLKIRPEKEVEKEVLAGTQSEKGGLLVDRISMIVILLLEFWDFQVKIGYKKGYYTSLSSPSEQLQYTIEILGIC